MAEYSWPILLSVPGIGEVAAAFDHDLGTLWDGQVGAKLTHSLDIINSFGELKVVVPLTTAQIPGTLETLKARKQHYLDERAKVNPLSWCRYL